MKSNSLYVKTEYSLLTSLIRIENYVEYAKEQGLTHLVLADETLFGVMKFYDLCLKNEITPIIGLTISLEKQSVVLYAENYYGYQNLLKLATIKSERELNIKDLDIYHEHLLVVVPSNSLDILDLITKVYPKVYLGYETLQKRSVLSSSLPKVFFRETLCLKKEDTPYVRYLHGIRSGKTLSEVEETHVPIHLATNLEQEQIPLEDRQNVLEIINNCNVVIPKGEDLLPVYECPNGLDSYTYLKQCCVDGLRRIFGTSVGRVYQERLKYELEVIKNMGFCNYFLVVWDYVKYAKEHNILVGPGRGSAGGSLVAYCLNITTIDPIKYDLLFERFLNPERITMPDIDIDFEDGRREEVIDYCVRKYGLKNVAGIIAFGTLAARQVVRDVGRVMDLPIKEIDIICKLIDIKLTLKENVETNKALKEHLSIDPKYQQLYQIALKLEGLKRHTTIHAAGIVMCKKPLDDVIPMHMSREDFYLTGYSMKYLEPLGLLKMDFLALKNLTLIHNILDLIEKYEHKKINFDDIPLEDSEATKIFTTTNTVGIFQFESAGMMNFLRKLKASSFDDVTAALALFRPGPMGNIDTYIRRKHGLEEVTYIDASLEPILKSTYGIMIYQEQIMEVARMMAGFSYAEADVLRRAMSKKEHAVMEREQVRFIEGSLKKGFTEEVSRKVFALIDKFASYGFNKSHSVGYAVVAYRMAYLKAHFPSYFMASLLSNVLGSETKTREYIYECRMNNIEVIKPSINSSTNQYEIYGNKILFPMSAIKNVGLRAIETILEERKKGKFTDLYDFCRRCYGKTINKKTMLSLIYAGVFDEFELPKKMMVENLDLILGYADLIKELDESFVEKPLLQEQSEYTKMELMAFEKEVFGFYFSNHPVTDGRSKTNLPLTIADVPLYFDKNIEIVVLVDRIKKITTKKGEQMCFVTGSDELNTLDIVLFPAVYKENANLEVGQMIKISGKVEKRFDKYQVIIRNLKILTEED